jgi:hypothetical protein
MNEDLPVYQEPYHGWRAWHVNLDDPQNPRLYSLWGADHLWPACERAQAACPKLAPWRPWHGLRRRPLHDPSRVPHEKCTCGFVALPEPAGAVEYLEDWEHFIKRQRKMRRSHLLAQRYGSSRPLPAFGRVDLWGDAIEHGPLLDETMTGVRTQFAYPQELWLPHEWWSQREDVDAASVAELLSQTYRIPVRPILDLSDIVLVWKATENLEG